MDIYDDAGGKGVPDSAPAVLIYIDGAESEWPLGQIQRFANKPSSRVSVLANPEAETMDYENGNAPMNRVMDACRTRFSRSLFTVIYMDKSNITTVVDAVKAEDLPLLGAESWPMPGIYLHVSDPQSGRPHLTIPGCPVQPVAVQYLFTPDYDISVGWGTYPVLPTMTPSKPTLITKTAPIGGNVMPKLIKSLPAKGKGYYLFWQDGTVNAMAGAEFYGSYPGLPANEREAVADFVDAVVTDGGGYALINSTVTETGAGTYMFGPE